VGIEPARCLWLRSYLTGRIQRIRIGDAVSRNIRVTSGVPQGSHLGPLCSIWLANFDTDIFATLLVSFVILLIFCEFTVKTTEHTLAIY
jgi:hypothetical protein